MNNLSLSFKYYSILILLSSSFLMSINVLAPAKSHQIEPCQMDYDWQSSVLWSPDNHFIATSTASGIAVFDLISEVITQIDESGDATGIMAFDEAGKRLAFTTASIAGMELHLYDLEENKVVYHTYIDGEVILAMEFDRTGSRIAVVIGVYQEFRLNTTVSIFNIDFDLEAQALNTEIESVHDIEWITERFIWAIGTDADASVFTGNQIDLITNRVSYRLPVWGAFDDSDASQDVSISFFQSRFQDEYIILYNIIDEYFERGFIFLDLRAPDSLPDSSDYLSTMSFADMQQAIILPYSGSVDRFVANRFSDMLAISSNIDNIIRLLHFRGEDGGSTINPSGSTLAFGLNSSGSQLAVYSNRANIDGSCIEWLEIWDTTNIELSVLLSSSIVSPPP